MKIDINVQNFSCEVGLTPIEDESGDMTLEAQGCIHGEVFLTENGVTMPLLSREDRKSLTNWLRDAIVEFVLEKTGYGIPEED